MSSQGFPNPSDRYKAVREAWFAVGVAKRPVVSSFSPTHGSEGDVVVIEGTDFTGISYVAFNDTWVAAPNFIVNDNYTQILIEVPAGATTGPIKLVAGYDTVTTAEDFVIGCETPLTVTVNSTNATSFTAQATGGTEPYTFSLDNQQFSSNNVFTADFLTDNLYGLCWDDRVCRGEVSFYVDDPLGVMFKAGSGGQGTSFWTHKTLDLMPGRLWFNMKCIRYQTKWKFTMRTTWWPALRVWWVEAETWHLITRLIRMVHSIVSSNVCSK